MSSVCSDISKSEYAFNMLTEEVDEYLDHCGPWVEDYRHGYSELVRKKRMVAVPHVAGISDRIVGIATVFLLAIVSDRAFQIGHMPELIRFETVFQIPHANISRISGDMPIIERRLREDKSKKVATSHTYLDPPGYFLVNSISDGQYPLTKTFFEYAVDSSLSDVMVSTNRGRTIKMFDITHLKKPLRKMGLQSRTAFGCAINFLFKPKPEAFVGLTNTLVKMADKHTIKIAIHIRTDDRVLIKGDAIDFSKYESYFECARRIESWAGSTGRNIVWFLFSDSIEIRRAAQKRYGINKLITAVDVPIEHTAKEMVCPLKRCVSDEGFSVAAAEWWLMGHADYFVVGLNSGYGKTAAMRTAKLNKTYTIYGHQRNMCDDNDYARLRLVKEAYAGI